MKNLKTFKKYNNSVQVDDYVIINLNLPNRSKTDEEIKLSQFINNNVGQVIKDEEHTILVKYINKPDDSIRIRYFDTENNSWLIWIGKANTVIGFGKTPEEVIMKVTANKYNL